VKNILKKKMKQLVVLRKISGQKKYWWVWVVGEGNSILLFLFKLKK